MDMEANMPKLPERKVGIVACSGEELAEGTVTRLAALKVLHELRPGKTVTICLPLFLAGGEGDRAFARFHPTVTIDGCELRCAARGTAMYSGEPAESIVVTELAADHRLDRIEGRRQLNAAGRQAVDLAAQRVTATVDKILGPQAFTILDNMAAAPSAASSKSSGCSCGTRVPTMKVAIAERTEELLALPLIFRQFRLLGRSPEGAGNELLAAVRLYNNVPLEDEPIYREAIVREYARFCREAGQ
jgi:uncharacterized metal-binding protein